MNASSGQPRTDLGAFCGEPEIKALFLGGLYDYRASGGEPWTLLHGERMVIPGAVMRLQVKIFKTLPPTLAKDFPLRFLSAIEPGADLTRVASRILIWSLVDSDYGIIRFAPTEQVRALVATVATLHVRRFTGDEPREAEWAVTRSSAVKWILDSSAAGISAYDPGLADPAITAAYHCTFGHPEYIVTVFSVAAAAAYTVSLAAGRAYVVAVADELIRLLATAPLVTPDREPR